MKLLRLSAAFSAAIISFLPGFQSAAKAQDADYLCFMTTRSGQVVDLSASLCGADKSLTTAAASSDQEFIKDYEQKLSEYPDVQDNLLADNRQSSEPNIRMAKKVCNDLKAGRSLDEIKQKQIEDSVERASIVNAEIVNALATKYYCPDYSAQ